MVHDAGKTWALTTMNAIWKDWKCRCKRLYYYKYNTYAERWNNRPPIIPDYQFELLLKYWDAEEVKVCIPLLILENLKKYSGINVSHSSTANYTTT